MVVDCFQHLFIYIHLVSLTQSFNPLLFKTLLVVVHNGSLGILICFRSRNDLTYNIHDYILRDLEDSHKPSPLLQKLRDEGKLGFKSGEGFRKWTPEEIAQSNAALNEYLVGMLYKD